MPPPLATPLLPSRRAPWKRSMSTRLPALRTRVSDFSASTARSGRAPEETFPTQHTASPLPHCLPCSCPGPQWMSQTTVLVSVFFCSITGDHRCSRLQRYKSIPSVSAGQAQVSWVPAQSLARLKPGCPQGRDFIGSLGSYCTS